MLTTGNPAEYGFTQGADFFKLGQNFCDTDTRFTSKLILSSAYPSSNHFSGDNYNDENSIKYDRQIIQVNQTAQNLLDDDENQTFRFDSMATASRQGSLAAL